ncbi:hypothetical protein EKK58_05710 [Candidatus Dependentiae bacterium]|nr:MAG: hypothetical protein EKK58_05710 [Candidatus Dependentiae bacterium]
MKGDSSQPLHPVVTTLFKSQLDRRELEVVKEPAAKTPRAPEENPAESQEAQQAAPNQPVKPGQSNSSPQRSRKKKG